MNVPFFIANKVIGNSSLSLSKLIIWISIIAVALGMTVMIVATSLISGFKNEISNKIFGIWGHITITDFENVSSNAYETAPISTDQTFYPHLDTVKSFLYPSTFSFLGYEKEEWVSAKETKGGISHIQTFAQRTGVIKTKDEIEGIVLKGIGKDYHWEYLDDFLEEGSERLDFTDSLSSREILISRKTADRLKLGLGDRFMIYFVRGDLQIKKRMEVKGIYKTGLEEYDSRLAIVDIRLIQEINQWNYDEVSGFEIFIDDLGDLEEISSAVYDMIPMDLWCVNIKQKEPNIFGWLELQDVNEIVILVLMIIVGLITMATALLVLILERTNMIGILKSFGATNWTIQKIFLYYGAYITAIGLLVGNVVGIGLCLLQKYGEIIKLSEEDYYVSVAPIDMDFWTIVFLNFGTLFVTVLILIIPSLLVRFITPVAAVRYK